MVVCILLPRFELAVAAGGREALATGPLALAPEIGREPVIGETSAAAEAYGVRAGLRLGEALARCPTLRLVAPDPAGVADAWERVVGTLEGIGAAVESDRPGAAWFEERGLRRLHGGSVEGVITAARRALAAARVGNPGGGSPPAASSSVAPRRGVASSHTGTSGGVPRHGAASVASSQAGTSGVVPRHGAASAQAGTSGVVPRHGAASAQAGTSGAAPRPGAASSADASPFAAPVPGVIAPLPSGAASSGAGRVGAAPSRFAALAAAHRARARRPEIAPESPKSLAAYLAPLPVSLLSARPEVAALPDALERFGIATLGELAALSRAHLADRFGPAGPLARDLARGRDTPLRPRVPSERLEEVLELPESASGPQLERALGMLIDRVLARNERRGRTVRAVVLSAKLVGGGTWRTQMTFREALADPRRMRLAITGRLTELPAPADSLRLRVEAFGPPSGDQRSLLAEPAAIRRARLREAVRQTRAAAGPDAALRILAVDPDSRVPERRLALAPWEP
jgi:nucleotidyltransferase/DNA polymerase involved in DNA repair